MQNTFLSLLIFTTLTGCINPETGGTIALVPLDSTKGNSKKSENEVCYTGQGQAQELCLPTESLAEAQRLSIDYVYQDPYLDASFSKKQRKEQYRLPSRLVDLERADEDASISKNFKLGDFMTTRKGRFAIFSNDVVEKIEKIGREAKTTAHIHSGYRSPGYNEDISGSAQWSRHMYGDAVDFSIPKKSFKVIKNLCTRNGASFVLIYKAHIHCDWRNSALDTDFFAPHGVLAVTGEWEDPSLVTIQYQVIGNKLKLSAAIESDEVEGDLHYEWQVLQPNGVRVVSTDEGVSLPRLRGTYSISVLVGGVWRDELTLNL